MSSERTTGTRDSGVLPGRRLPDAAIGAPGPGWDAWTDRQPGDYMRVDLGHGVGWYVCDPRGEVGLIGRPRRELAVIADLAITVEHPPPAEPWTITEHADGTITVSPSIMKPGGWHGYLTRGEWRSA